jgi:glycosyltransferase involved in cell wall biosynthesis
MAASLRGRGIDLLHTQHTGCEEAPIAAAWARLPNIVGTFHVDSSYDLDYQRSGIAHRCLEWASNRCLHHAIAVSEATKRDWVARTGLAAHRIVTIHNGINPQYFQRGHSKAAAREALGLPQHAVIAGSLGRLDAAKGFKYLLEAMALLRPANDRLFIAIAGSGSGNGTLRDLASQLGISDRIIFLGQQPDVNVVLDAYDVFVIPSLCEALPFALLESMAHQLPAIGTIVGGIPEVIVPGVTGFLCPPRDPAALAAAIRPLLESPDLCQRMGGAGRERVIKHFHEDDMVRKTIAVYREMLGTAAAMEEIC